MNVFGSREPEWDAMAANSMHRELIGKMPPAGNVSLGWMRCDCGMLVVTRPGLRGMAVACPRCVAESERPGARPNTASTLTRRANRNLTFAFCIVVAVVFGWLVTTVSNGGQRPADNSRLG